MGAEEPGEVRTPRCIGHYRTYPLMKPQKKLAPRPLNSNATTSPDAYDRESEHLSAYSGLLGYHSGN